jgi:ADP-ribosylglycohydrolase
MAVDHDVFDVGIQTSAALSNFRSGCPAVECGGTGEYSNGNGSLMRVLPLALWHRGSDRELVDDARLQSRVTHAHPRSQLCCALYCLWARRILEGADQPWPDALASLRGMLASEEIAMQELEFHIRPDADASVQGTGYVVDCLRSAHWAASRGEYEIAVRAAIGLGADTDTTACVAGGIVGLRDGLHSIPQRWRAALRGQELFLPLLEALLDRNP